MQIMKKTPKGTIFANSWEDVNTTGIAAGIFDEGNFISLEFNETENRLEVLINKELMTKQGFTLFEVDEEWDKVKEIQL